MYVEEACTAAKAVCVLINAASVSGTACCLMAVSSRCSTFKHLILISDSHDESPLPGAGLAVRQSRP